MIDKSISTSYMPFFDRQNNLSTVNDRQTNLYLSWNIKQWKFNRPQLAFSILQVIIHF